MMRIRIVWMRVANWSVDVPMRMRLAGWVVWTVLMLMMRIV